MEGVSLTIIVKAPWYKTILFRVALILVILFLIWFVIYSRVRRIRRKHGMEKKVLKIEGDAPIRDHPDLWQAFAERKLALIRDINTGHKMFRELATEITMFVCYEALKNVKTKEVVVETPVDVDHCLFDQVGGGTLDGRVHRSTLGKLAHVVVFADDIRQRPDAPQQGAGAPGFPRLGNGLIHKTFNTRVARKIMINICFGHFLTYFKLPGKAKSAHAVNNAEIDSLGLTPEFVGDK